MSYFNPNRTSPVAPPHSQDVSRSVSAASVTAAPRASQDMSRPQTMNVDATSRQMAAQGYIYAPHGWYYDTLHTSNGSGTHMEQQQQQTFMSTGIHHLNHLQRLSHASNNRATSSHAEYMNGYLRPHIHMTPSHMMPSSHSFPWSTQAQQQTQHVDFSATSSSSSLQGNAKQQQSQSNTGTNSDTTTTNASSSGRSFEPFVDQSSLLQGSSIDAATLQNNGNAHGNVSPNALKDITNQEKQDDEKEVSNTSTANISIPKGDTISTTAAASLKRQSLDSLSLSPSTCSDATALISPVTADSDASSNKKLKTTTDISPTSKDTSENNLHLVCAAIEIVTNHDALSKQDSPKQDSPPRTGQSPPGSFSFANESIPTSTQTSNASSSPATTNPTILQSYVTGPMMPPPPLPTAAFPFALPPSLTPLNPMTTNTAVIHEQKGSKSVSKKQSKGKNMMCSCPKSKCVKLYCECFQAGNFCSKECKCTSCHNTTEESGPSGKRTLAINRILARNPHAFNKNRTVSEKKRNDDSGVNCRCVKSNCLKLYCDCFQSGQLCGDKCMCVKCLNTKEESGAFGEVSKARAEKLSRNPKAFEKKVKKTGEGCACKNNKCLKKYCDCFSNGIQCTSSCVCRDCQNKGSDTPMLMYTGMQRPSLFQPERV
ncbi:hypothetical protein CTEN210_14360 [Chaetoceros tenuissimus]|uniref:CRC domain-containing protein n=1 Tax=Chaetoceros tenuissimus TaxID=426638 RepID=A0AAD3D8D6_9STRA|nr:hypothetical protein CTEN210_14360 [Chaetoceros tenuissimus]